MKRMPEAQIIRVLACPRAALDRLVATGRIEDVDLGYLQFVSFLANELDRVSGKPCPDTAPMDVATEAIESGVVDEDSIVAARSWVDDLAAYMRRLDIRHFDAAHRRIAAAIGNTQ